MRTQSCMWPPPPLTPSSLWDTLFPVRGTPTVAIKCGGRAHSPPPFFCPGAYGLTKGHSSVRPAESISIGSYWSLQSLLGPAEWNVTWGEYWPPPPRKETQEMLFNSTEDERDREALVPRCVWQLGALGAGWRLPSRPLLSRVSWALGFEGAESQAPFAFNDELTNELIFCLISIFSF